MIIAWELVVFVEDEPRPALRSSRCLRGRVTAKMTGKATAAPLFVSIYEALSTPRCFPGNRPHRAELPLAKRMTSSLLTRHWFPCACWPHRCVGPAFPGPTEEAIPASGAPVGSWSHTAHPPNAKG